MNSGSEKLLELLRKGINVNVGRRRGIPSLLMAGAGIAHGLSEDSYMKPVIAFLTPSLYTGYHLYKERECISNKTVEFYTKFNNKT